MLCAAPHVAEVGRFVCRAVMLCSGAGATVASLGLVGRGTGVVRGTGEAVCSSPGRRVGMKGC